MYVTNAATGTEKTLLWDRMLAEGTHDPTVFRAYEASETSSRMGTQPRQKSKMGSCCANTIHGWNYWMRGAMKTIYRSPAVLIWPILIFALLCGLGLGFVIGLSNLSESSFRDAVIALGQSTVRAGTAHLLAARSIQSVAALLPLSGLLHIFVHACLEKHGCAHALGRVCMNEHTIKKCRQQIFAKMFLVVATSHDYGRFRAACTFISIHVS
jgi:hypothetical protein